MENAQIFNIVGLTLDIIGVIMLFRYRLPSDINRNGQVNLLLQGEDAEDKLKWKKYNFLSRLALFLLIIGFMFQITSNIYFV